MGTPSGPSLPSSSVPAWLAPVVQITTSLGVPTVFAGVLLWYVLTRIDGAMRIIQEQEDTRTKMVAAMQDTLISTLERQTTAFEAAIHENIAVNRELAERYHGPAK
jgi:hypothetical protein